jgi:hypothetical protein
VEESLVDGGKGTGFTERAFWEMFGVFFWYIAIKYWLLSNGHIANSNSLEENTLLTPKILQFWYFYF